MIALQSIPLPAPAPGKSILRQQFMPVAVLIMTLLLCGCASESPWKEQAFAFETPAAEIGDYSHTNVLSLRGVAVSPLFEGKALVYRTGDDIYERDPYADFLVPPDQMLDEDLRLYLRAGHAFAAVLDPDSGLQSSCCMAVSVSQLYGDFRQADKPVAVLQMHFLLYSTNPAHYGRALWQQEFSKRIPVARRTAATLIAGWDAGLQNTMDEVNTEMKHLVISENPPTFLRSGYTP
jgi:uncharacterized lipoprotein YmbA